MSQEHDVYELEFSECSAMKLLCLLIKWDEVPLPPTSLDQVRLETRSRHEVLDNDMNRQCENVWMSVYFSFERQIGTCKIYYKEPLTTCG